MSGGGRVIRQELPEDKSSKTTSRKNTTGTVLVRAEEMLNIFNEWMRHGSGDFIIDESLCERLTKYTQYRKELDKAIGELMKQEFERYRVYEADVDITTYLEVNFTSADNKVLLIAQVFAEETDDEISYEEEPILDAPKLIRVRDFKRLLASLGNKVISYAYVGEEDVYFDYFLYCKEMGIDIKIKNSKNSNLITIQLILPEDMEKQNGKNSSSNVQ